MKKVIFILFLVIVTGFESEGAITLTKQDFDIYLFHFYFRNIYKDVLEMDPTMVRLIPLYHKNIDDFDLLVFSDPLTKIRGLISEDITNQFTFDRVSNDLGNKKCKVTDQPYPQNAPIALTSEIKSDMLISKFIDDYINKEPKNKNKKRAFFAKEIDMDSKDSEFKKFNDVLFNNLPLQFRSSDLLHTNLDVVIPGVNEPQLFIKTFNAWTGTHEENSCLRSINICHGPGSSLWLGVKQELYQYFDDAFKKDHKADYYENEFRFFPTIEFCLKHGIEVTCTIQSANEIILVAPGTRHW